MKWTFFILSICGIISGCVPFMSNEQQTTLWMTKEERIESFKQSQDYYIGKEFYRPYKKEKWCKSYKCKEISDTITEYIEEHSNSEETLRKCVIAWSVDANQSSGNYQYMAGPISYGFGKRLSWRYVSNPKDCLTTLQFWGPW